MTAEGPLRESIGVLAIGCDVGGTHTDAVLLEGRTFQGAAKVATTDDVTGGIVAALRELIGFTGLRPDQVTAVMVGTTHFTNAVVQRQGLAPVACVRMGAPEPRNQTSASHLLEELFISACANRGFRGRSNRRKATARTLTI